MVQIFTPQDHKQRALKPVNSRFIPENWLFLDTETKAGPGLSSDIQTFHLGWTCLWIRGKGIEKDTYSWKYFTYNILLNKYISNLSKEYPDLLIVGHNIFFDLQASGFYVYFTQCGWRLKFYYDKGLTYILKCHREKHKLTVISTTNWFDQSLDRLGQTLGLPKGQVDFKTVKDKELKEYCKRDVEILVKAVQEYISFIRKYDLGKFSLTKASQAFTAFRHRFMSHKIYVHNNPDVQDLERKAYMGGRVECFFIGQVPEGPFVSMDINSMYPTVMKGEKYPFKLIGYYENPSIEKVSGCLQGFAVIAEVEVNTLEPVFAVKQHDKTIFPIGNFTCFVCSEGLRYGIKKGYIVKINRASIYLKADLFSEYVDYFKILRDNFKKQGNDIFLLLSKYMHNSLYGKFAQLKIITNITHANTEGLYIREEALNMVTGRTVIITKFMNSCLIQHSEGEGDNSNVAISAHITENARFKLWDLINDVGIEHVLYCDTDSVKLRKSHLNTLTWDIDENRMGALKCEDESDSLYIGGSKNYRTEKSRKIKGIPTSAKEIEPGVFQYTSFKRQVSHLRSSQDEGAIVEVVTRSLSAEYQKGQVLPSGKVIPLDFSLPEWLQNNEDPPF